MPDQYRNQNLLIIVTGLTFMFALLYYVFGSTYEGIYAIAKVKNIKQIESADHETNEKVFAVKLDFLSGPYAGKTMETEHFETPGSAYNLNLEEGQTILAVAEQQEGQLLIGVDEHYKSRQLMLLAALIIIVITALASVNGVKAMLALFLTLIIIFGIMARMLLQGAAPVPVAIVSALAIIIINIVIIAGRTRKALIAGLGTLSGVILAGLFGWAAAMALRLTGYSGDESTFLQILDSKMDLRGIMISGIIIGALGAVMDVAISIASSLLEISLANPLYDRKKLFTSGMNIGKDIIGSMVNTLILAYTGASLTLILVFTMQREDFPLIKIMNMEFICTEVVRSLAGLFGMVLAIPITAFIASVVYTRAPHGSSSPKQPVEVE
ncbi:MAG: YibE/F family protein [Candidatus Riflebacteria bacterium]|nr:YibE/F family protein [Candidatus Riflebacteria bacterium]